MNYHDIRSLFIERYRRYETMILERIGIYGWNEHDENLLLAGLLTGDPVLLIGTHGTAKTHLATKLSEALGKQFITYDASKALFEDVLGYPDIKKLQEGIVSYIPSKVTLWDKEFVFIDELNRALPEMQNKWLEIIRSRKIMGYDTNATWVWAAMNPLSYAATQALDEALVGRFALFVYPPELLDMTEHDRVKIAGHINGDDAPALKVWNSGSNGKTVDPESVARCGTDTSELLARAGKHFTRLTQDIKGMGSFLARYADLLARETNNDIRLDGRRLGFMYRNIIAAHTIELAKAELTKENPRSLSETALHAIKASIPIGINDEHTAREESLHKVEICFDLLKDCLEGNGDSERVERIYELFTTDDLLRKTRLLITENLGEMASSKAWHDMLNNGHDVTLFAYTALQVEAHRPGTIPQELLESLSAHIKPEALGPGCLPQLKDNNIERANVIERLLERDTDMGKLLALQRVKQLAGKQYITEDDIAETNRHIIQDIETFNQLITEGVQ